MERTWQQEKQKSETKILSMNCPNHWMTNKLCMHREELKVLKAEKVAEARGKKKLHLINRAVLNLMLFQKGTFPQLCTIWAADS